MSQKIKGLNREFEKRDVERMRNLVKGKYGDKTETDDNRPLKSFIKREIFGNTMIVFGLLKMVLNKILLN